MLSGTTRGRGWGVLGVWLAAVPVPACSESESDDADLTESEDTGGGQGVSGGGSSSGGGVGGNAASQSGGAGSGGAPPAVGGVAGVGGMMIAGASGGPAGDGGDAGTGVAGASGGGGIAGGGAAGSGGTDGAGVAGGGSDAGGMAGSAGVLAGGIGGAAGVAGMGGSSPSCPPARSLSGGTRYCSNSKGKAGSVYSYELWSSGQGTGCMTVYGVDATFSATWTDAGDFLARVGLTFDQTKTPSQIGNISAEFSETKTEVPTAGKTSKIYLAVYGWTVSPLTEFYVIDDYGTFVPGPVTSDNTPRTNMGTITVDGGTYDIWSAPVTGKPAITGNNMNFTQIFSVRQVRRQCGHISVSEHFSKWVSLGLPIGKLEETMFLMEGQNNSGTLEVKAATVTVN